MAWPIGIAGLAALSLAAPTVAPPSRSGAWHQLGAAVTSAPGKPLRFYRQALSPKALGIVLVSSSARPITLLWTSYCEVDSDDGATEDAHGRLTAPHSVVVYPPVLDGATLCYVWVNASMPGTGRIAGAEFAA